MRHTGFPQSWKILEILEKKLSWKVMEKSWKIAKIQNVMEICFPGKKVTEKSLKSVVQIRLIVFLLCCGQCGSRLYSLASLITTIVLHCNIYLYLECHVGGADGIGCTGRRRPLFCNTCFSEQ